MLDNETTEARAAVLASLLRDDPIEETVPYEPFGEAGTMLPPSPEMMESLQYEPNNGGEPGYGAYDDERSVTEQLWALNEDNGIDGIPDKDDAEYATYADTPASINEDDELPPYSIFARYWATEKPVKYPVLACGHKYRNEFEPNHRNCERCWFAFFQTHGELTQAVEEAYQTGGAKLVSKLRGPKFLHQFLKFLSTVAFVKMQQEAAEKVKEHSESITGRTSIGEQEGSAGVGGGITSTEQQG